jgi:hypothetical protein
MNRLLTAVKSILLGLASAALWANAQAASILYVANGLSSSSGNEPTLVSVLEAEGHTVTEVFNDGPDANGNLTLQGDLSPYDAVYWAASDSNKNTLRTSAATISALEDYVEAGGFLYITGYDSIASPADQLLADFIAGATGVGIDDNYGNGTVTVANVLTQGVVDLVGVRVDDLDDQDEIAIADLGASATGVSCDAQGCSVILRTLGSGYVAYVSTDGESNGDYSDSGVSDDYYAYNGFLRNFAFNANARARETGSSVPVPTLPVFGLGILISLLGFFGLRKLRR